MKQLLRAALISLTVFMSGAAFVPALALAAPKDDVCDGIALTGTTCGSTSGPSVDSTITLVVNILSLIVGVVAVIMIIIGGLKYVTSQGEGSNTANAKNTILYAIVGLIIVALAQIIVKFVLNRATS